MIDRQKRFTTWNIKEHKYVFDKYLFRILIVLMLILFATVFIIDGVGGFYIKCPTDATGGLCQNPFFKDCFLRSSYACADSELLPSEYNYLKELEFLRAGDSFGKSPSRLFINFPTIVLVLFLLTLYANHILNNTRRKTE